MMKSDTPPGIATAATDSRSPLSPTITRDFAPVFPKATEDPILTPEQMESRVLQLTSAARQLIKLGLSEPAFESLLKAYLIDPLNPQVLSCEKVVLPAWELTRKHSRVNDAPRNADSDRLKILKAKKESERLEKEKAVWEKASGRPKLLNSSLPSSVPQEKAV
jgi:hypothetical protein